MKKQLSCALIVTSIFTFNALPVQASNKRINLSGIKNQLALTSGHPFYAFLRRRAVSFSKKEMRSRIEKTED